MFFYILQFPVHVFTQANIEHLIKSQANNNLIITKSKNKRNQLISTTIHKKFQINNKYKTKGLGFSSFQDEIFKRYK